MDRKQDWGTCSCCRCLMYITADKSEATAESPGKERWLRPRAKSWGLGWIFGYSFNTKLNCLGFERCSSARLRVKTLQHGAENSLPSAEAWSSNLLDYLTTLALIQSNNGEPNWGPNHATRAHSRAIDSIRLLPRFSSYITLLMEENSWQLQKRGIHHQPQVPVFGCLLILLRRFDWFTCEIGSAAQCVAKTPAWRSKTNVQVFEHVLRLTDCPKRLRSSAVTFAHGSKSADISKLPSAVAASRKHSTNSRDTRYEPCDSADAWQKTSWGGLL